MSLFMQTHPSGMTRTSGMTPWHGNLGRLCLLSTTPPPALRTTLRNVVGTLSLYESCLPQTAYAINHTRSQEVCASWNPSPCSKTGPMMLLPAHFAPQAGRYRKIFPGVTPCCPYFSLMCAQQDSCRRRPFSPFGSTLPHTLSPCLRPLPSLPKCCSVCSSRSRNLSCTGETSCWI